MQENENERRNNEVVIPKKKTKTFGNFNGNNRCIVIGKLETAFEFSHVKAEETFYKNRIIFRRLSGNIDHIPIVISETILKEDMLKGICAGKNVEVSGKFRSRKVPDDKGIKHLILYMYVTHIEYALKKESENLIFLRGKICSEPKFRITEVSKIPMVDFAMSVRRNSSYEIADIIPCVAWYNNAEIIKGLKVGDEISVYGRIQSRYFCKISCEGDWKEVYEIAINEIAENNTEK